MESLESESIWNGLWEAAYCYVLHPICSSAFVATQSLDFWDVAYADFLWASFGQEHLAWRQSPSEEAVRQCMRCLRLQETLDVLVDRPL